MKIHLSSFTTRGIAIALSLGLFTASNAQTLDLNGDLLPDIWQQYYAATAALPDEDSDNDGFTNSEESAAGTDPFLAADYPRIEAIWMQNGTQPIHLIFPTKEGKRYQLEQSPTLSGFQSMGPNIKGSGHMSEIAVNADGVISAENFILHEQWANITGTHITDLTSHPAYPASPNGISRLHSLEIPRTKISGYGGRVRTLITPPQSGNYIFYISSASPATVSLSTDTTETNLSIIANLNSSQLSPGPNLWNIYPNQSSESLPLLENTPYLLDLKYLSTSSLSHTQVGWSGPGIDGIQPISAASSAKTDLTPNFVSENILLQQDYNAVNPTLLWTDNTELVPGLNGGQAERFIATPSNNRTQFPTGTTKHFYATWLLNMEPGHEDLNFRFRNHGDFRQIGPTIDMEAVSTSGIDVAVRSGGSSGHDIQIPLSYNTTYRVEIVANISSEPYLYQAGLSSLNVAEDTFDLYVSDTTGRLVGSARGLVFRSEGTDIVQVIDSIQAPVTDNPEIILDDFEISAGSILGNGYLSANIGETHELGDKQFFRVQVGDSDQDNDGISDWAEMQLARGQSLLFFDSESQNGTPDSTQAQTIIANHPIDADHTVSLAASDTAAYERTSPSTVPDYGEITLSRTGPLSALTVQLCIQPLSETGNTATICDGTCCSLVGSAGAEAAEVEDYELIDENGEIITDSVTFAFGQMSKVITVRALADDINEYPETLNIAIQDAESGQYQIDSVTNGASIQLFDLPDNPNNFVTFSGNFSPEMGAITTASGETTAVLNGTRTKIYFQNSFFDLTSDQQDSHIHKSNVVSGGATTSGAIIYEITEIPGIESEPKNGFLTATEDSPLGYPWDLTESSGAVPTSGGPASKQTIIDSLFAQNNESPLYLNIHTVNYPAGEIWAFLRLTGGSRTEPPAPPESAIAGSIDYPQLEGDELESEIRRFLNQATFGATDEEVESILNDISTNRSIDPNYHRSSAYEDWIDNQIILQQSYLLDFSIAKNWQYYTLTGLFDESLNPSSDRDTPDDPSDDLATPTRPSIWPKVNRDAEDPEHWYLDLPAPIGNDERRLGLLNGLVVDFNIDRQVTHVLWQMMLNSNDQLRQKMGFALQQIVVTSLESGTLDDQPYGMVNYMDQLNTHAFNHYRDILGFVNWSPIMGRWLSSLQNQKAADLDGDGEFDIFPDENLARENMQLFSIGLQEIWADGSPRLSSDGLPIATYTNDDIREFAKVLTGQSFGKRNEEDNSWGGLDFASIRENQSFDASQTIAGLRDLRYSYPMKMFGEFHDLGVKHFAGTTINNTDIEDPAERGIADINDALDWLAGSPGDGIPDFDMQSSHRSTPAFICRRLIQRFTTSNPSPDYLHRVSLAFKESEGNLTETIKAILLDSEARVVNLDDTIFGMKKSPLEAYAQILRSLRAFSYMPLSDPQGAAPFDEAPGNLSNPDLFIQNFGIPQSQLDTQKQNMHFLLRNAFTSGNSGLQMNPMNQETVFNWYLPDYAPAGRIANAGFVAPELQLANEQDVIRNINYFQGIARSSNGNRTDTLVNLSDQRRALGVASDNNSTDTITRVRLDRIGLAAELYPLTPPTPTASRTSESLADEILVDALDKRLTLGYLKRRYPYDPSDDEDPNQPTGNDLLKNPRELIIDALAAHSDPYNGSNDENDRINKLADAIYLITLSPEFQIKK